MPRHDRKVTRRAFLAAGLGGLSLVLAGGELSGCAQGAKPLPVLDSKLALYRNPAFTRINVANGRVQYRTGLPAGEIKLLETDVRGADLIAAAPSMRAFKAGTRCTVGDLAARIQRKYPNEPELGREQVVHRFIQQALAQGVLLASFQQVYIKGQEPAEES